MQQKDQQFRGMGFNGRFMSWALPPFADDEDKTPADVEPELALDMIIPSNSHDMRMFLNLVEFAQEFLQK
jgi:hypothetical protein